MELVITGLIEEEPPCLGLGGGVWGGRGGEVY